MAVAKKKGKKKKGKASTSTARQLGLEGMRSKVVKELETLGMESIEIKEKIERLQTKKADVDERAAGIMKKHGVNHFAQHGVDIRLQKREASVKVKVKRQQEA